MKRGLKVWVGCERELWTVGRLDKLFDWFSTGSWLFVEYKKSYFKFLIDFVMFYIPSSAYILCVSSIQPSLWLVFFILDTKLHFILRFVNFQSTSPLLVLFSPLEFRIDLLSPQIQTQYILSVLIPAPLQVPSFPRNQVQQPRLDLTTEFLFNELDAAGTSSSHDHPVVLPLPSHFSILKAWRLNRYLFPLPLSH